ncbi:MAG TPA: zf-HC2 domain-containing protein [Actinomycetota bacterium]|nr:zf-HC2 domain-containing protein [Actinomycetota bacterium]
MRHEDVRELLSAYVDGDLQAAEEVEAHLASCADCRSQLAAYREMLAELANLRDRGEEPHPAVLARSLAAIPAPSLAERLVESAQTHPIAYAVAVVGALTGAAAIAVLRRRRRRVLLSIAR